VLKKEFGNGPNDEDVKSFLDAIQPFFLGFMSDMAKRYKKAHDEQVLLQ